MMCAGINLLPGQKELSKNNKRLFFITILLNSMALLGVLLIWHLTLWRTLNTINKININTKNKLYKLEQKISKPEYQRNDINKSNYANHINMIANNQHIFTDILDKINKNILTNMQLTRLNINTNQGKIFGTTEEITDIAKILQDFIQSQYCTNPKVEQIVRQNYRYSFILSWHLKH